MLLFFFSYGQWTVLVLKYILTTVFNFAVNSGLPFQIIQKNIIKGTIKDTRELVSFGDSSLLTNIINNTKYNL